MILAAGEALVDLVIELRRLHRGASRRGAVQRVPHDRAPRATGGVSRRTLDRPLRHEAGSALASEGVDLSAVVTVNRPTTLALAELDEPAPDLPLLRPRHSAPAVDEAAAVRRWHWLRPPLYVGTLGLVLEPLATATKTLVDGVDDDVLVFLDPNCRPTVTNDRAALSRDRRAVRAPGRRDQGQRRRSRSSLPGGDAVQATRSLLRPGAVGLVTRGADGVTIVTAGQTVDIAAPKLPSSTPSVQAMASAVRSSPTGTSTASGRGDVEDLERVIDGSPLRRARRRDDLRTRRCGSPRRSEVEARVAE